MWYPRSPVNTEFSQKEGGRLQQTFQYDEDRELTFDSGNMDVISDFDKNGGESHIWRGFKRVGGKGFEIASTYSSFEQFC